MLPRSSKKFIAEFFTPNRVWYLTDKFSLHFMLMLLALTRFLMMSNPLEFSARQSCFEGLRFESWHYNNKTNAAALSSVTNLILQPAQLLSGAQQPLFECLRTN